MSQYYPYPEPEREPWRPPITTAQLRWVFIVLIVVFVLLLARTQLLTIWLNVMEFGGLFIRPLYFEVLGGFVLAVIALVRIDVKNRRSLTWWLIGVAIRVVRERGVIRVEHLDFETSKMGPAKFAAWQVTKVLLGMLFLGNVLFGMSISAMLQGWDPNLGAIWGIFRLPFVTPPSSMVYAAENVVPLVPSLTLLLGPLLGAMTIRLIVLVGLTNIARIATPTPGEGIRLGWRIAVGEALIALGILWAALTSFFTPYIDYNTRYAIGGLALAGIFFLVSAYLHRKKGGLSLLAPRRLFLHFAPVVLVALVVISIMAINNNIADARKIEWLGPYSTQQIAVNRYLAELDEVREVPYSFTLSPIPQDQIGPYVADHQDLVGRIRLWDWDSAFAKLKPEIGLIPYVDYEDSDILRFNGSLYWSASMKPILPETVRPEDRWYGEHLVYTHVPRGFYLLDASEGRIVDVDRFFEQRRIYYGEGGLLEETWAAYPVGREVSDEITEHLYEGSGGLDLPPPLSWLYELNFFLAYRDQPIHVMRYRDAYQRMEMLFPYFVYEMEGERVDMLPVTDGRSTYYMMPLIVRLDARIVPWSRGNAFMRLVGYALIDAYNGDIQLLVLGDDYFSELFRTVYSDYVITEIPEWLRSQMRYPEELYEWRVNMYNYYHVRDPATFITAKEFFEIPSELETYYIMAQPMGFQEPEFMGLLSLELRGAKGKNLAGYMMVRNDYPDLGEMIFYQVPLEAEMKLLGPGGVMEALEKNPDFRQLKTLLRSPRIGDKILYRVGDYDVYFIPIYTAGAGGVVTELGTVAAVGAPFTGEYFIGLGDTAEEAFTAFLAKLARVEAPPVEVRDLEERRSDVMGLFEDRDLSIVEPQAVYPDISFLEGDASYASVDQWNDTRVLVESFIQRWLIDADEVLMWTQDSRMNFGVLVYEEGIVELHFITISLE